MVSIHPCTPKGEKNIYYLTFPCIILFKWCSRLWLVTAQRVAQTLPCSQARSWPLLKQNNVIQLKPQVLDHNLESLLLYRLQAPLPSVILSCSKSRRRTLQHNWQQCKHSVRWGVQIGTQDQTHTFSSQPNFLCANLSSPSDHTTNCTWAESCLKIDGLLNVWHNGQSRPDWQATAVALCR